MAYIKDWDRRVRAAEKKWDDELDDDGRKAWLRRAGITELGTSRYRFNQLGLATMEKLVKANRARRS